MRVFFILLVVLNSVFGHEIKTIQRENVQLRDGPGSIYQANTIIKPGTAIEIISNVTGWCEIQLVDKSQTVGWVSENAFKESKNNVPYSLNIDVSDSLTISTNSASGAIKGFFKTYLNIQETDITFDFYNTTVFSPQEYQRFVKIRAAKREQQNQVSLYDKIKYFDCGKYVDYISFAAAVQILNSNSLISKESDIKDINILGTYITQQTPFYDKPFKFFILDDDRLFAYALPNGFVFISFGLYEMTDSEDELACTLAQEISHVVCQHGAEELLKKATQIRSEMYFYELNKELSQFDINEYNEYSEQNEYVDTTYVEFSKSQKTDFDSLALSLENLSSDMYNYATQKRQNSYEYEADKYGVIYAYNLGYDPNGLVRVLKNIDNLTDTDFFHPESNWQKDALEDRILRISNFITDSLHYSSN
ncbi:MAG: M48 family metalloprotease [Nanoarchaeota archaeon]|nr:M48 family metalloprotease [Nanoarchaeota archaeon]